MADKSFGVDQLDILGTGTPTISAPNQLNLDAHTVAISTSVTVGEGMSAVNISATGISTIAQPANSNPMATWKLGGGSGSGFTFTGPGQDGSEGNPDIYLVRGQRYLFDNTVLAGNHPFEFRNAANTADYTDGVSGAQNGLQYLNVQHDAPARLKYRCTIHTSSMLGDIYIIGGPEVISGVVTATTFVGNLTGTASANAVLTGSTNNTLVTVTGANAITGESNLTFDGTTLGLTGNQTVSGTVQVAGNSNFGAAAASPSPSALTVKMATNKHIGFSPSQSEVGDVPALVAFQDNGSLNSIGFRGTDLRFAAGSSERLRIADDGDIGVGVASPDGRFHIMGGNLGGAGSVTANSNGDLLVLESNQSDGMSILVANDERANIFFGTTGTNGDVEAGIQYAHEAVSTTADRRAMIFRAGGGERARIQSGKLIVGRTNSITITGDGSSHVFEAITDNGYALATHSNTTNKRGIGIYYPTGGAAGDAIRFAIGSSAKFIVLGSGNVQNANNSYTNISDATLKENIVDANSQWNDIKNIKIRNYNFKASSGYDTHTQIGVIAQELETVAPKLVDSSGKDGIKSVASSVLYMKAVKALQEAMARIETLEAEVAALKSS